MLGLPEEQVVVRYAAIGGAFGGREDLSVQHLLALAAWKLQRRVGIVWSREESILAHHKRHPFRIRCRWGATRDGRITAVAGRAARRRRRLRLDQRRGDEGRHALRLRRLRDSEHRGRGQGRLHQQHPLRRVSRLRRAAGPVRRRDHGDPPRPRASAWTRSSCGGGTSTARASIEPTQQPLPPGVSALPVLERCVEEARDAVRRLAVSRGAPDATRPWIRRGIGIAAGMKNLGYSFGFPEQSTATVEVAGPRRSRRARSSASAPRTSARARTWRCARSPSEVLGLPLEPDRDDHRRLSRGAERRQRLGLAPDPDGRASRARRRREGARAIPRQRRRAGRGNRPVPARRDDHALAKTTAPASRTTATATRRRRSRSRSTRSPARCGSARSSASTTWGGPSTCSRSRGRSRAVWRRRSATRCSRSSRRGTGIILTPHLSTYLLPDRARHAGRDRAGRPGAGRSARPVRRARRRRDAARARSCRRSPPPSTTRSASGSPSSRSRRSACWPRSPRRASARRNSAVRVTSRACRLR